MKKYTFTTKAIAAFLALMMLMTIAPLGMVAGAAPEDDICPESHSLGTGHVWSNWEIVTHPKDDVPGLQRRECFACHKEETMIINSTDFFIVNFYNYDKTRVIAPAYCRAGTAAARPVEDPTRPDTVGYTYTFCGWDVPDEKLNQVYSNITATARYTSQERIYKVTYKDYYENVIATKDVLYSEIGRYVPEKIPTRPADSKNTYTFTTWTVSYNMKYNEATATPNFMATPKSDTATGGIASNVISVLIQWIKNMLTMIFGDIELPFLNNPTELPFLNKPTE